MAVEGHHFLDLGIGFCRGACDLCADDGRYLASQINHVVSIALVGGNEFPLQNPDVVSSVRCSVLAGMNDVCVKAQGSSPLACDFTE